MEELYKILIIITVITFAILIIATILFVLYGLPQVKNYTVSIHNMREDNTAISYNIDNLISSTLQSNESQIVTIKNGSLITTGNNLKTNIYWTPSMGIVTDIYIFIETVQTNLTTFNLTIENSSDDTFYIWILPSQIPPSTSIINSGERINIWTFVGQQLGFGLYPSIESGDLLYYFTSNSTKINSIIINDYGITTGSI